MYTTDLPEDSCEHTLSVVKFCEYMVGQYDILNKDLLYTAAMCHDIGKTIELSPFPENDYTDDGQLLGHIIIGIEMIDDAIREIPEFPKQLASELKHCIVAHHGELRIRFPEKTGTGRSHGTKSCRQRRRQDADIKRNIQRQKSRRVAWI